MDVGAFTSRDGLRLAWYRWDPDGPPHGTICLGHGQGEHAGRYHHIARSFARAGFVFLALDWRGHGRSEGPRGHAPSLEILLDDFGRLMALVSARPCIAYGHSMGGLLVLALALAKPDGIRGVIATSPWLRLVFPPPRSKVVLGRLFQGVLPSVSVSTGLEPASLSHDAAVVESYAADPLVHDRLSFRLGTEILDAGERILARSGDFRLPLLLMHGESDPIIDARATTEFFEKAGSVDKTLRLWPGLFHETHNELEWEKVVEVSTGWAVAHAG